MKKLLFSILMLSTMIKILLLNVKLWKDLLGESIMYTKITLDC